MIRDASRIVRIRKTSLWIYSVLALLLTFSVNFSPVEVNANSRSADIFQENHPSLLFSKPTDKFSVQRRRSLSRRSVKNSREINSSARETQNALDDTCEGKADKYYPNYGSNCSSYYSCAAGFQATYLCDPGLKFNGIRCTSDPVTCPQQSTASNPCARAIDGYYAVTRDPHRYFYCYHGSKVIELRCSDGKIYDEFQQKCLLPSDMENSKRRLQVSNCAEKSDGFYPDLDSACAKYYYCVQNVKTELECQGGQAFNGDICASKGSFKCPKKWSRHP